MDLEMDTLGEGNAQQSRMVFEVRDGIEMVPGTVHLVDSKLWVFSECSPWIGKLGSGLVESRANRYPFQRREFQISSIELVTAQETMSFLYHSPRMIPMIPSTGVHEGRNTTSGCL